MTRGQETLLMELESPPAEGLRTALPAERPALRVVRASAEEQAEHERVLAEIGQESRGNCLWQERQA
jgi:DNA polymerase-3 subunit epsilon